MLHPPVQDDVLDDGIADVAHRVDNWSSGGRDGTEVVREGEDGPAVADRAKSCVLGVGECPIRGELCTDGDVFPGLISGPGGLKILDLARGSGAIAMTLRLR